MDRELCETSMTGEKLEELLLATLSKGRHSTPVNGLRLIDVDARPIGIQGYVSKVLQIRLTWNRAETARALSAPDSVIVKCPTSVNLQRMFDQAFKTADGLGPIPDASMQIRDFHNDEIIAYDFFVSSSDEADNNREPLDIPIPRIYGVSSIDHGRPCTDGVLVMEDMSERGRVMKTLGSTLSLAQIFQVTDALANLHAWSHVEFSSGKAERRDRVPTIDDRLDRWQQLFCNMTPGMIDQMKVDLPNIFAELSVEKMMNLFSLASFLRTFGVPSQDDRLPVILVHGDIQPMNIIFSNKPDDGDRLVGLIDYQLCHRGYGPEDLARLLSVCSRNEIKRKHGDEVLRRYVEVFNTRIKRANLTPIKFEDVKSVFTEMYAYTAMLFATTARLIDQFVEAVENEEERARMKDEYIQHCAELYRDAVETLGW